ncbi:conserved hypothetical protein [Desulfosarcina cetonica]|uniref:DUF3108 domain-containing protein n=1 Tax=Desulfosarcina cetonica TaxID=90730 RepID=UPI0006CF95C2|nr:DUF3108 domain-containing protein [Desulfosarcina cetonica]VTR70047.1 conserved hypothetical protein [Desulfosarcina cetonica]
MSTAGLNNAHWMAGIRRIAASVICALTIMTAPNAVRSAEVADRGAPFIPGERLTFVLKWTIVPAGEAVLEVLSPEFMAGQETYHFVLTARSNAFVDAFYTVRDRIDAWAGADMRHSVLYRKKQHEGSTRNDITVAFDWAAMHARYANHGNARDPISIVDGTFDPLSIYYWSRSVDLAVGTHIQRPVTDGKKQIMGHARVIRQERVTVPAGTFDTFLIEPDLRHVGGVFDKRPDAKIQLWVSADPRRLPVKLKSKVVVGSFSGELVSIVNAASLAAPEYPKE